MYYYGRSAGNVLSVRGSFSLSNGMFCKYGVTDDGIGVDVYKDKSCNELISEQRGIQIGLIDMDNVRFTNSIVAVLQMYIESIKDGFAA